MTVARDPVMPSDIQAGPSPVTERITAVDALRGFALLGVFLANLFTSFSGWFMLDPHQRILKLVRQPLPTLPKKFLKPSTLVVSHQNKRATKSSHQVCRKTAHKKSTAALYHEGYRPRVVFLLLKRCQLDCH